MLGETVEVDFNLNDGGWDETSTYSFDVIVVNEPPLYLEPLVTQNMNVRQIINYYTPQVFDPESNVVVITATGLNSFITLVGNTINISPPFSTVNSTYTVYLTLDDGA